MSKTKNVYKDAYNRILALIGTFGIGQELPPETQLSQSFAISRTTVRAILEQLDENGIVAWNGRSKRVLRLPAQSDHFNTAETLSSHDRIESAFTEYLLRGDLDPGAILRETELARQFDTSSSAIRQFLTRFSHFGLIEKKPNRHWVLNGFTQAFATELFDVRELFELRAIRTVLASPSEEVTRDLHLLVREHGMIRDDIEGRYHEFPRLDERFHRVLIATLHNRFIDDFYKLMSLIFHYHYRWNKVDEAQRNAVAVVEHLALIDALLRHDEAAAIDAFECHMASARRTLLASVQWA